MEYVRNCSGLQSEADIDQTGWFCFPATTHVMKAMFSDLIVLLLGAMQATASLKELVKKIDISKGKRGHTVFIRLCRLNALLVIPGAIGFALAAAGALLVLAEALTPTEMLPFRWFAGALTDLDALTGMDQGWAYGGAAVALVIGGVLALGNVWALGQSPGYRAGQIVVEARPERSITVSRRSLEAALAEAARETTGVAGASVSIHEGSDGIDARARLRLDLPAGHDTLKTIGDAEARMARVAREDFGLVIGHVDIATEMAAPPRVHA